MGDQLQMVESRRTRGPSPDLGLPDLDSAQLAAALRGVEDAPAGGKKKCTPCQGFKKFDPNVLRNAVGSYDTTKGKVTITRGDEGGYVIEFGFDLNGRSPARTGPAIVNSSGEVTNRLTTVGERYNVLVKELNFRDRG